MRGGELQAALPSWPEIYTRAGEKPPMRNRARCPIHGGDSPTSVSLDPERGLFYCHACGAGGDRVDWIKRVIGTDFPGALRWMGIEPGLPPKPDPQAKERRRKQQAVWNWVRTFGRQLRDEFYTRDLLMRAAQRRLQCNPEDNQAWDWLAWALPAQAQLEYWLDIIDLAKTDADAERAYELWHAA